MSAAKSRRKRNEMSTFNNKMNETVMGRALLTMLPTLLAQETDFVFSECMNLIERYGRNCDANGQPEVCYMKHSEEKAIEDQMPSQDAWASRRRMSERCSKFEMTGYTYFNRVSRPWDADVCSTVFSGKPDPRKMSDSATRAAEALCSQWLAKLLFKMGSLRSAEIQSLGNGNYVIRVVTLGGVEATIRQQVVVGYRNGKRYVQFPARIYIGKQFITEKAWITQYRSTAKEAA